MVTNHDLQRSLKVMHLKVGWLWVIIWVVFPLPDKWRLIPRSWTYNHPGGEDCILGRWKTTQVIIILRFGKADLLRLGLRRISHHSSSIFFHEREFCDLFFFKRRLKSMLGDLKVCFIVLFCSVLFCNFLCLLVGGQEGWQDRDQNLDWLIYRVYYAT